MNPLQFFDSMWSWLDGRKTVISTILLVLAAFLEQIVVGQWGVQSDVVTRITGTLEWLGMVLGGLGLTHKGVKVVTAAKATADNGQGS